MVVTFTAPLWLWSNKAEPEKGGWAFVTLPQEDSALIRMAAQASVMPRRGFGSQRVKVRIGESEWATSIFPDKKAGAYLLPIKMAIRKAEDLAPGDEATITLSLDL